MKANDVKIGDVFRHDMEGKRWRVRIIALPKAEKGERREWNGELAIDQHGLTNGDSCWGYIDELLPIEESRNESQ